MHITCYTKPSNDASDSTAPPAHATHSHARNLHKHAHTLQRTAHPPVSHSDWPVRTPAPTLSGVLYQPLVTDDAADEPSGQYTLVEPHSVTLFPLSPLVVPANDPAGQMYPAVHAKQSDNDDAPALARYFPAGHALRTPDTQ